MLLYISVYFYSDGRGICNYDGTESKAWKPGSENFDPVRFGQMASVVFVRALKQSDALYNAMESRCYDGEIRVLSGEYRKKQEQFTGK